MYSVYMHETPSKKVYIGITSKDPAKRWNNGWGYYNNIHFRRAIKKYGWENIKHEILFENLPKHYACMVEKELIDYFDSTNRDKGYNLSAGGEHPGSGRHVSDETRKWLRKINKGKKLSEETKKKLSEAHKGKKFTKEHKIKIAESNKGKHLCNRGRIPWNKGMEMPEQYRKKLSESCKGRRDTDLTKKRKSDSKKGAKNSFYGKNHSIDAIERMRRNRMTKQIIQIENNKIYFSISEAARITGIGKSNISNVLRGKAKTAGGYHWKYLEEGKQNEE